MLTQSIALDSNKSIDLFTRQALPETISPMMNTVSERIQYAIRHSGLSKAEIARRCDVSPQAVNGWIATGRIRKEMLYTLASITGVEAEWIAVGGYEPTVGSHRKNLIAENPASYNNTIPVVGTAQLGLEGYWEETQHPVGYGDGLIIWHSTDKNAYSLRCVGDSMSPRIRHGEFVIVEPNHAISPGDEVLVKTADGQSMIKIYLYERDGRIYLESVNEKYGQAAISREAVTKMHYVAGIAKSSLHRDSGH